MRKINYVWLTLAVIMVVIAPALFTRPSFANWLDFSQTGQIGDTLGGITAPIVGLISILLLYLTLKSQLDFNKSQASDNSLSQIVSLQSNIISSSNALEIRFSNQYQKEPISIHGLFHIHILEDPNANFYSDNLRAVVSQIVSIETLCLELLEVNSKSSISITLRQEIYSFAGNQLDAISYFYRGVKSGSISAKIKMEELYDSRDFAEELFCKDPNQEMYAAHIDRIQECLNKYKV